MALFGKMACFATLHLVGLKRPAQAAAHSNGKDKIVVSPETDAHD